MAAQLRRYHIRAGRGEQFAQEWRESVAPMRGEYGFRVNGWLVEGTDEFIWLLEHKDRQTFEAADAAYYASAERRELQPDPARLVDDARHDWVNAVF